MSAPAESAAERVAAADREKHARWRARGRERVRARFDELLTLLGLALVVEMTGEDKSNLIAMRKGRRPIPQDLQGAVEELAEQGLSPEPHAADSSHSLAAPGTAHAIDLMRQAIQALGHLAARFGAGVRAALPSMRRHAPVTLSLLVFSCNDPTFKAYEEKATTLARYAEEHPGDIARLAVQTAMPPPPRRYRCDGDAFYHKPASGERFSCERGGHFACATGDCAVRALGDNETDVEGTAGWWALAPGAKYSATWGTP